MIGRECLGPSSPQRREQPTRRPSLRRRLYGLTALLALVALTASAMLVFLTHASRRQTDRLAALLDDDREVDALRSGLDVFERDRNLGLIAGRANAPFDEAARELQRRSKALDRLSPSSDPVLVRQLRLAVTAYLDARRQAEQASSSLSALEARVAPAFRAATNASDALARQQEQRARELHGYVVRSDVFTDVAGGVTAALFLAIVAVLVLLAQRSVFEPLFALREAIDRFGEGELGARLPPQNVGELADLAERFNAMAAKLEQERQRRLTFLAAVAHDMANPLMAMKMSAGVARRNPPRSAEHWRELFERVDRLVLRLQRMVGDLLDASRIEAGQLELRSAKVDLRALVDEAAELHQPLPEGHHLEVIVPDAPVVAWVDETRVAQVLNNLIGNAIKYSPHGGTIRVRLDAEGGQARLAVSDEGIGIAPEELERVFEPFRRSPRIGEEIPGVGLGLSVVRRIVRAHEGSIRVESTPGVGSTFVVSFPLAEAAAAEPPPAEPAPGP